MSERSKTALKLAEMAIWKASKAMKKAVAVFGKALKLQGSGNFDNEALFMWEKAVMKKSAKEMEKADAVLNEALKAEGNGDYEEAAAKAKIAKVSAFIAHSHAEKMIKDLAKEMKEATNNEA